MKDENVLVVSRSLIESLGMFQGLHFDVERYLAAFMEPGNHRFLARRLAEEDPAFKQIIPYVILVAGERVFHYVRGKKGGETRLHAKGSIGIGGHMIDADTDVEHFHRAAYEVALARELGEEVGTAPVIRARAAALLNDDSSPVGAVHLGVVHVFELAAAEAYPREEEITESGFLGRDELWARRGSMETWSQICVDGLDRLLGVGGMGL